MTAMQRHAVRTVWVLPQTLLTVLFPSYREQERAGRALGGWAGECVLTWLNSESTTLAASPQHKAASDIW